MDDQHYNNLDSVELRSAAVTKLRSASRTWRRRQCDHLLRRLQYPGAPCLSVGSGGKPVWLPAEVCRVRRGQRKLKLDDKQTAEVCACQSCTSSSQEAAWHCVDDWMWLSIINIYLEGHTSSH